MDKVLLVYLSFFGLALAVALLALRNDENFSRKWARIRVRIDENSRSQRPDPPDEEFEPGVSLEWWIIGAVLLVLLLLIGSG